MQIHEAQWEENYKIIANFGIEPKTGQDSSFQYIVPPPSPNIPKWTNGAAHYYNNHRRQSERQTERQEANQHNKDAQLWNRVE